MHPAPHVIRDAIASASNGDTVRIHGGNGHYHGSFTVNKRLRIVGAASGPLPVIDGDCKVNDTILVIHGGVVLSGLRVRGADEGHGQFPSEILFQGVFHGRAEDLAVRDTCNAEYGINLFSTGPIKVLNNIAVGFEDSGIYVGGITNTGPDTLLVRHNDLFGNARGVIVEDSSGVHIRVARNTLHNNDEVSIEGPSDGLFLHNSLGIVIVSNQARANGGSGFHADPNSHGNMFFDNTALANGARRFRDESSGNCGSGNNFNLPAC